MPDSSRGARHAGWLLVFALAAALRLLYLQGGPLPFETRPAPTRGDAARYVVSAADLAAGEEPVRSLVSPDSTPGPWMGPRSRERTISWLKSRGPAYVLFLAALFRGAGIDLDVVRYVQALLGTLACVCVYAAGCTLASRRVGLIAGLLAALHPSMILFTGRMIPATLGLFLLWLGFLVLVYGLRVRSAVTCASAGATLGLAMLTRPTLLVTIPFQIVGTALATRGAPRRGRAAIVAGFAAALLLPLAAWSALSSSLVGDVPTIGGRGLRIFVYLFLSATSADLRGWRSDDLPYTPDAPLDFDGLPYRAVALLSLVFNHLWFLDNLWREVPTWMHAVQRVIFVMAVGGLGLAVASGRRFAPLVALAASYLLVSAKYIEIRPMVPLIPAQLLLAGVFVDGVARSLASRPRSFRALALPAAGAASIAGLLFWRELPDLALLLPTLHPVALGHLGDLLVGVACLAGALLLYRLYRPGLAAGRAAVAAGLPALVFVALFAAYAAVGSSPRWRAFEVDLARLQQPLSQKLVLDGPLSADGLTWVAWLVDMRSEWSPPPIRVAVNGVWLPPERYAWRQVFCVPHDRFREKPVEAGLCFWYREGLSEFTRAYPVSPQWWSLEIPAELVAGRRRVSLTLAPVGGLAEHTVSIGGAFSAEPEGSVYGPLVWPLSPKPATSLYRWHVLEDWRLWGTQAVRSRRTESRLPPPRRASAFSRADLEQQLLAAAAARGQAHLNIRLLAEYRDGRRILY